MAIAAALLLVACSSSSGSNGANGTAATNGGATSTTAASTSQKSSTTAPGSVYVVQEAGPATLTPGATTGDPSTLTLTDAESRSVYFTGVDRPRAGTAEDQDVLDAVFPRGSTTGHDAALSWSTPNDSGTLVVTVLSGTWDADAKTLTYQVRPIDATASTSKVVKAMVSPSAADMQAAGKKEATKPSTTLPADISTSSLFIDPVGQDQAEANCKLSVVNTTPWAGSVVSINSADGGGMTDWDQPLQDGQALPVKGTITASSGNSGWDCHAKVGIGFTDDDGNYYARYVTLEDPVFSKSSWSCIGAAEISCAIQANDTGQPMNLTVTLTT